MSFAYENKTEKGHKSNFGDGELHFGVVGSLMERTERQKQERYFSM